MKLYTDAGVLRAEHEQGGDAEFQCATCGQNFPLPKKDGASGYALDAENRLMCYPCADEGQRREVKELRSPFVAYVSSDMKAITTWAGGKLMVINSTRRIRLTRSSFTHGKYIHTIRAQDPQGVIWLKASLKSRPI